MEGTGLHLGSKTSVTQHGNIEWEGGRKLTMGHIPIRYFSNRSPTLQEWLQDCEFSTPGQPPWMPLCGLSLHTNLQGYHSRTPL